jgi:hypothetical protein
MEGQPKSRRRTPKPQDAAYVMNATQMEQDVREIKVALLGDFDKPGLLTKFGRFQDDTKEEIKSISQRTQHIETKLTNFVTHEQFKPVLPVVQTVNNWKWLLGILAATITSTGALIYAIVVSILDKAAGLP